MLWHLAPPLRLLLKLRPAGRRVTPDYPVTRERRTHLRSVRNRCAIIHRTTRDPWAWASLPSHYITHSLKTQFSWYYYLKMKHSFIRITDFLLSVCVSVVRSAVVWWGGVSMCSTAGGIGWDSLFTAWWRNTSTLSCGGEHYTTFTQLWLYLGEICEWVHVVHLFFPLVYTKTIVLETLLYSLLRNLTIVNKTVYYITY